MQKTLFAFTAVLLFLSALLFGCPPPLAPPGPGHHAPRPHLPRPPHP